MEKVCKNCGKCLAVNEFYGHPKAADGKMGICKSCHKNKVSINREFNKEYYLKYDRMRKDDPERKEKRKKYVIKNNKSEKTKESKKKWLLNNPEKRKAHILIGNMKRDGKITQEPCSDCGSLFSQAHHFDYTKPAEVVWLCCKCHSSLHVSERKLEVLNLRGMKNGTKRYKGIISE